MKKFFADVLSLLMTIPFLFGCNGRNSGSVATSSIKEPEADWTVLTYIVASDLEEDAGMYSNLLKRISGVEKSAKVNYVAETGGTRSWAASYEELGLTFKTDKIQRFEHTQKDKFTCVYESDLVNMALAETLTDFIKWGIENYPAKHYELVLCDHGGGPYLGMLYDKAFSATEDSSKAAVMTLDQYERALKNGGAHFDLVYLAACLMSGIEVVQCTSKYADYLLASEEYTTTAGDASKEQLEYLNAHSDDDVKTTVKELAKLVGEKERTKGYQQRAGLALTDLSKEKELTDSFNGLWSSISEDINDIEKLAKITSAISLTDRMTSTVCFDAYSLANCFIQSEILLNEATRLKNAVTNAVIDQYLGTAHSKSYGLNFFYNINLKSNEFDKLLKAERYNLNYIAYLDAVTPWWTAPDYVYDQVERIPEIRSDVSNIHYTSNFENFQDTFHGSFEITSGVKGCLKVEGALCIKNSKGDLMCLGRDPDIDFDPTTGKGSVDFKKDWPSLIVADNEKKEDYYPLDAEITQQYVDSTLYQIPIWTEMKGSYEARQNATVVATLDNYSGDFDIHGICTSINNYDRMPGGQYTPWPEPYSSCGMLCPTYYSTEDGFNKGSLVRDNKIGYQVYYDETMALSIEHRPLKAGTYVYSIIVTNLLGREVYNFTKTTFTIS